LIDPVDHPDWKRLVDGEDLAVGDRPLVRRDAALGGGGREIRPIAGASQKDGAIALHELQHADMAGEMDRGTRLAILLGGELAGAADAGGHRHQRILIDDQAAVDVAVDRAKGGSKKGSRAMAEARSSTSITQASSANNSPRRPATACASAAGQGRHGGAEAQMRLAAVPLLLEDVDGAWVC
jgi:hypothetical protein